MDYEKEEEEETGGIPKIKVIEASNLEFVLLGLSFILAIVLLATQFLMAPGYEYTDPIYAPLNSAKENESTEYPLVSEENSSEEDVFPIKINSADYEHLQKIPGIGPVMAQKIITYRKQCGTIVEIDELLSIDGIGKKTVEVLKEYCVVD